MKIHSPEELLLHDAAQAAVEEWKAKVHVGLDALFGNASPAKSLEASDAFNQAMERLANTLN